MICFVLPAFNEADSLERLLRRVANSMTDLGLAYRVLVVDDGSTDTTADIVEHLSSELPIELVRHPTNFGFGRALKTGVLKGVERADIVVTMDADDSHDPGLVGAMVKHIDGGSDLVIASRFQNGSQEVGVPLHRKVLSHGASFLFRRLFPIDGAYDYTSGFRAYRSSLLLRLIDRHGEDYLVTEEGFASGFELLLKARASGALITEVPLVLRYDRKQSASKLRVVRTVLRLLVVCGSQSVGSLGSTRTEPEEVRTGALNA